MAKDTMTKEDVKSIFADLIGEPKTQYARTRTQTALGRKTKAANIIVDFNLLERMVRVEEGTKHTLDAIQELQRSTDKRLEAMQTYMDKRLEVMQHSIDKRFKAVFWSAGVCFGVLTALMSGMFVMLINIVTG